MSSTGTRQTGFATADLGPFHCRNCQKWASGVCMDDEVAADQAVPDRERRLAPDGHIRTEADECCNEFLSLKDKSRQARGGGPGGLGQRLLAIGSGAAQGPPTRDRDFKRTQPPEEYGQSAS
jgi:hypothetical protein